MLGCKCLLNEQEQIVFVWLVLQVCSWRTARFVLRYIGVMPLCGMWLQSRGLKWDLLFQNPLLQILPAQLHLLKFAFLGVCWSFAADACRNGAMGIYISLASALLLLSRCFSRYRITPILAVNVIPTVLIHLLSSVSSLVKM